MTEMIHLPQDILKVCETASQVSDCIFYGASINLEPNTISIFIEPPAGNTLKTCEKVMNHIKLSWPSDHARLLKQYHLEVSTPGIERFLLTSAHFEAAIGQMVRLVYNEGTKTKTAKGELASYKDGILALKIKAEPLMVDIQSIVTCNLIHDIKVQHEKS